MKDIRIGTSGFDYADWEGVLYPSGTKKTSYLEIYSENFSTLELNFSYYAMPKAQNLTKMLDRTRPSMDFSIKANKTLTHEIDESKWSENVKEYTEGILPLAEANRLSAILMEFPQSFHYEPNERRYLDKLLTQFDSFPVVVELRNKDWNNPRVIDALAKRNIGFCLMDMPFHDNEEKIPITSDLLYIRLHGRNAENWWTGNNISRYDYLYNNEELNFWVKSVRESEEKVKRVRIYFNNHAKGKAVENAKMIEELLKG